MKHLLILTVGICLLISVPMMADQAADEAAIRAVYKQALAAYNNHDAKAFAPFSADKFEDWLGTTKGRAALEKQVTENFERQKDLQAKLLDEIGIVFVTPDVAIHKYRYEITGRVDSDGKPLPPQKYLSARVLVKKNGKWLYTAVFQRPIEE